MTTIQHIAYSIWFALWCGFVAFFAAVVAWHWWKSRQREYHGRHRQGEERSPLVNWLDDYLGRIQHWIAVNAQPVIMWDTQELPLLQLDDTQSMILPDFTDDEPQASLTHYDQSTAAAGYLHLKDSMLERELEAWMTRTEVVPTAVKLRPAFMVEDWDRERIEEWRAKEYAEVTP